jgi:hypothetical protein
MFDGLISRWTTPCSWTYTSASATSAASVAASRTSAAVQRACRRGEGHALDEIGDEEGDAAVFAHFVHRHDRGVSQVRHVAGLAGEPLAVVVADQDAGMGYLDRHRAIELGAVGLVH